ncbi:CHAT domain-containing protein [Geminocystis sp. GBBB08]|uniref:CHAT domain-containing protein n=1 Tax=Geminocystis sp. GBBB08 TaxID=2604140 RepID=UPI0027E384DE|nr:CHAT domain-containing protein [Geminocystis sp. GBBB08]MBL1208842.1 CHAT domain-containing protein [Geminocystis sp. GBBB08]
MGKLILFKLESGSFVNGFDVSLQICEDNPDGITHPFTTITGKLPPCQPITQHYQQWQESYRSLHQKVRLGSSKQQVTHVTNNCQVSASQLKETLRNWYHCEIESFGKIREKLLTELDTQESIRLLIQTNIKELRFLPWHLFFDSFLNLYHKAELAIAPIEYSTLNISLKESSQIKILAIFGNSQGINLKPDEEVLTNLKKAEIITLTNPSRQELFSHLYEQEWDLLFFAGHSGKNEETWQGKLYLNEEDIITVEEFNHALKQAIQKGLKLAIFNSCDGLGLAQDLVALHLSQIIVMGEIIPDIVAHVFIKEFLQSFADNQPLYLAVRKAREKLQPLETQFPCATWLPIICQNPASLPLTWQNLQGLEINPDFSPSKLLKTPENFTNLVFETVIANTQLTLEYNSLINCNVEVLVNYTDIDLSMSEDIARILLIKGGKTISKELEKRKIKQLGQILTTGGGKLKVEGIFHGIIYDYQQPELTDVNLVKTIINRCLTLADSSGFNSIAFPVFLPQNSLLSIEKIAVTFAQEIINYLQGNTKLEQVKVILQNTSNLSKNILDERLSRFYRQFKQFLDLGAEFNNRILLLEELKRIYQQRKMESSINILNLYQENLSKFQENWVNNNLQQNPNLLNRDYHQSLEKISYKINHNQETKIDNIVTSLHQNYHEKAGEIWQQLINLNDEEEIIYLFEKLDRDIDGFAWINDQYELAIISVMAKQKKINEMLQTQVEELKKGQHLLQQRLLYLHQQKILNKKEEGNERNLIFREYPKINVKVKPEELPQEYRVAKITYTADKKALKEANNKGIDISKIADIDPNLKVKFGFKTVNS